MLTMLLTKPMHSLLTTSFPPVKQQPLITTEHAPKVDTFEQTHTDIIALKPTTSGTLRSGIMLEFSHPPIVESSAFFLRSSMLN
jgi:hypothetical protein